MAYRQRRNGEQTLANYSSVIVDEVQDISEIALRLLHSLTGNRQDGLLLIGDATQRIFTRGYTLKGLWASILREEDWYSERTIETQNKSCKPHFR